MEHYKIFDEYLKKSQDIQNFCNERETAMCNSIRLDIPDKTKIHYLTAIGREIDAVLAFIKKMTEERKIKALGV